MSKNIKVSDETYEKIKGQLTTNEKPVKLEALSDIVGHCWFFRTVTYHIVGRVICEMADANILVLEDASWIADSGRFMQAIKDGTLKEVELLGQWCVNLDTVTDFGPWRHPLPTEQK